MTNVVFWNSFAFRGNWSLNSWTDLFQSQETQYRVQECRSRGGLQWSVKGGTQDTASPEPKRGHRPGTGQPLSSPPAVSLSSHVTLCPQSQPKKNRNKIYKKMPRIRSRIVRNVRKVRSQLNSRRGEQFTGQGRRQVRGQWREGRMSDYIIIHDNHNKLLFLNNG